MATEWLAVRPKGDLSLIQLKRTEFGQYAPYPFVIFPQPYVAADIAGNDWTRLSQMLAHEIVTGG